MRCYLNICILVLSSIFSLISYGGKDQRRLFSEGEFQERISSHPGYTELLKTINQDDICKRDYKVCSNDDEFNNESNIGLQKGMKYISEKLSECSEEFLINEPYLKEPPQERDFSREESEVVFPNYVVNSYCCSICSNYRKNYGGNEDRVFNHEGLLMLKGEEDKKIKAFVSIVVDGHSFDRGGEGVGKESILENRVGDLVKSNFWNKLKDSFSTFVSDISSNSMIQKALVYTVVDLSRDITDKPDYDEQGSTINLIFLIEVEEKL